MTRRAYSAYAQRVIRGQLAASWHHTSNGQIVKIACRFGFVLEILTFNVAQIFFQYSLMLRISWCKPNLHLKARSRDNDTSNFLLDHAILRCHEICHYM